MKRAAAILLTFTIACGRKTAPAPRTPPIAPHAITSTAVVPKTVDAEKTPAPTHDPIARDLDAIRESTELRAIFTFNSTGYFLYRGETMGYEYELLNAFARDSKLKLVPYVVRDSRVLYNDLNDGHGDIVAAQLVATTNQSEVAMTRGLYETAPVLVQRNVEVKARLIAAPSELGGQSVHIPRTSPYINNLLELNDELTQDIDVVEVDESSDRLIEKLAQGDIRFTVAAENVAALKTGEYSNLVLKPAMGPPQPIVWAVRRNAPQLLDALNRWIDAKKKSGLLGALYRKYFLDRRGFEKRSTSQYLAAETGALSPYDELFREYAKIPGWDWRLIAAQAYQESKFNPRARSWAGAVGLMQIMPRTARSLKVNANDPEQSIKGACRYLWQIDDAWKDSIPNESERIKFILASYNVGTGHVQDAVRLAQKYGGDPGKWDDVAYWLIRKSKRSVYDDPVVRHGFARGTEPVAYVDQILSRWANYREFVLALDLNENSTDGTRIRKQGR
jgi:membrane-bound lytic murein transglycosylase F